MLEGKGIFRLAIVIAALACADLPGGEHGIDPHDGLISLRKNAVVTMGGEVRIDYDFRAMSTSGLPRNIKSNYSNLMIKHANLRLRAEVNPNLVALFKIDMSSNQDAFRDDEEMLEEAMLVMRAIGGTGLGFFAGKGRVPYGQDITLGMLQSYHHAANRIDSAEGRVFIVDPPDDFHADPANPGIDNALPPMRPGQHDRAAVAGVSYEIDGMFKAELAAFQPNRSHYEPRLYDVRDGKYRLSDVGLAGRVWWSPAPDLVLEASGMVAHSESMGDGGRRHDLAPEADATDFAYALSLGFDWRRGPWRLFGEYQHAWDWNFSRGYDTDTWQVGMSRELGHGWRLGAMVENLRIDDRPGRQVLDEYWKFAFNVKYEFTSGLFILAEYGHEWLRRKTLGTLSEKRRGNFIGLRLGFSF